MKGPAARGVGIALATVALAVVALAAFTWWALEADGVAIVTTRSPDGSLRQTHVWYVEPEGELWVEAGTPENGWFRDVRRDPVLDFAAQDRTGRYRAEVLPNPDGHRRIRALLRAKYGLRDAWIATVFDTGNSVAVRLLPP